MSEGVRSPFRRALWLLGKTSCTLRKGATSRTTCRRAYCSLGEAPIPQPPLRERAWPRPSVGRAGWCWREQCLFDLCSIVRSGRSAGALLPHQQRTVASGLALVLQQLPAALAAGHAAAGFSTRAWSHAARGDAAAGRAGQAHPRRRAARARGVRARAGRRCRARGGQAAGARRARRSAACGASRRAPPAAAPRGSRTRCSCGRRPGCLCA